MSNQQYYGAGGPTQQYGQNANLQHSGPNQHYDASSNAAYTSQQTSTTAGHQYSTPGGPPGQRPLQRTDTDAALPQGRERSEQLEYMQSYEARAQQTDADKDQEILRKEFPNVDSSLIAALYADSESLSATREMLHELSSN
ncbi:uncharacterized protein PV09_03857 [Verruconis gallopava]|uniref:Uncharacterized protein n=1 Tax=Verruconis gallopava TaxID=253628 RepID=A0A0D2AEB7_9PEZI|nr:uncharacterized protein PV09_03857 [Verruconis gallopava]KIW05338.1 hypothetical protein PV09_03857 [Verruconis gallopava]